MEERGYSTSFECSNVKISVRMGGGGRLPDRERENQASGLRVAGLLGTGMSGESSFAFLGLVARPLGFTFLILPSPVHPRDNRPRCIALNSYLLPSGL